MEEKMRELPSGSTRDAAEGKLCFVKALSPEVLKRYVTYLGSHRKQADGQLRGWDNWKKGINKEIYLDSGIRHAIDVWCLMQGISVEDNHGSINLQDTICAVLINFQGLLFEILKEENNRDKPIIGGY